MCLCLLAKEIFTKLDSIPKITKAGGFDIKTKGKLLLSWDIASDTGLANQTKTYKNTMFQRIPSRSMGAHPNREASGWCNHVWLAPKNRGRHVNRHSEAFC